MKDEYVIINKKFVYLRYESIWNIQDASLKTNISRTAISNNIAGLSKLAGGYIWKYKQLNN